MHRVSNIEWYAIDDSSLNSASLDWRRVFMRGSSSFELCFAVSLEASCLVLSVALSSETAVCSSVEESLPDTVSDDTTSPDAVSDGAAGGLLPHDVHNVAKIVRNIRIRFFIVHILNFYGIISLHDLVYVTDNNMSSDVIQ